jgi:hypothetical protein
MQTHDMFSRLTLHDFDERNLSRPLRNASSTTHDIHDHARHRALAATRRRRQGAIFAVIAAEFVLHLALFFFFFFLFDAFAQLAITIR